VASVVEMTGDFTLRLPVMLAVAIATTTLRALSYGTIYHTKLLRRGRDIDRAGQAVAGLHGELFGMARPVATMVVVAWLLDLRWKVEIVAEAVVGG